MTRKKVTPPDMDYLTKANHIYLPVNILGFWESMSIVENIGFDYPNYVFLNVEKMTHKSKMQITNYMDKNEYKLLGIIATTLYIYKNKPENINEKNTKEIYRLVDRASLI